MEFIRANQAEIFLALSSVCFIILLFIKMTTYISKEKKRALLFFAFATFLMLLSCRYTAIYQNQSYRAAYYLAPFWKFFLFFNVLNVSYGFNEFLLCLYKENNNVKKTPRIFNIIRGILIIGHILLIISQFTNLYYSYDSMNIYHREKFYALNYCIPLIATIIQYSILAKMFKNTSKRVMIPLVLYFTLPLVGAVVQLFIQNFPISNMMMGGVTILLYLFVIYDANVQLKEKEKTEADLRLANEIQQNEIPNDFPAFPNREDFDLYAIMQPAKEVGGDFYDYFLIDNNHLGLVIADVSGKGVPAALNMVKAKLLVEGSGLHLNDPAKVLTSVNNSFIDNNKMDMFVTMWFGIIEISTGKLTFANAGHEDVIISDNENGFDTYKTKHGIPLGTLRSFKYENHKVKLSKGNKLFLYTDGVTDSINENKVRFGINNLVKALNKYKNKNAHDLIQSIKGELNKYSGENNQFDDVTMLCFELTDNNTNHVRLREMFKAEKKEINKVYDYFTDELAAVAGLDKVKKYYVVIDEIFSNIVKYGFKDNSVDNYIIIDLDIDKEKRNIKIVIKDNGIPFNPLEKEDPNIKLSAKDRKEGGLGIFIVKKMMDKVSYEYNNANILTIEKKY